MHLSYTFRTRKNGVEYLVEDYKTTSLCPKFPVKRPGSDVVEVFSFGKGDRFLKIYRLLPTEK